MYVYSYIIINVCHMCDVDGHIIPLSLDSRLYQTKQKDHAPHHHDTSILSVIRCFTRHAMLAPALASGSPPNHLIMVVGFSLPTPLAANLNFKPNPNNVQSLCAPWKH